MMTRVLIADDHAVVRAGLRLLLSQEAGMELIGEATGGQEALQLTEELSPEILILDLSMPDLDGIQVTRAVHQKFPQVKILILTVHEDEAFLREAIHSGASGYILKHAAESEMMNAIRTVQHGDIYIHSSLLRALLEPSQAQQVKPGPAPDEALTPREKDVLCLIVQGYTNREIADKLNISQRTVEGHRANLTAKLNIHSRVELLRYARSEGLV
jgi:two-component system, NarL family, response regulator NreC